jgi:glycosyltransferase involved in cell wall biosynthesis
MALFQSVETMRIKLYIVTYKSPDTLKKCVDSILGSDFKHYSEILIHDITVINNHPYFQTCSTRELHNEFDPGFSKGRLAHSWNKALIDGFQDLSYPDADIVITCQDDTVFLPDAFSNLVKLHERYGFITAGYGDAMCSYTPEAVKRIGLWDERFCGIGYQEADYFLRASLYYRDKSSINDGVMHGRLLNPVPVEIVKEPVRDEFVTQRRTSASEFHQLCLSVFQAKWGAGMNPQGPVWPGGLSIPRPLIDSFIQYPDFEKKIETLYAQRFVGIPL